MSAGAVTGGGIGPVAARLEIEDIAITARTGTVRLHGNRPQPTSPIATAMATTAKAAAATVVTRFPAGRNAFSTPDSPAHQASLNYPSSSPPIRWVVIDGEPVPGSSRGRPAKDQRAFLEGEDLGGGRLRVDARTSGRGRPWGCSVCASEPSNPPRPDPWTSWTCATGSIPSSTPTRTALPASAGDRERPIWGFVWSWLRWSGDA